LKPHHSFVYTLYNAQIDLICGPVLMVCFQFLWQGKVLTRRD